MLALFVGVVATACTNPTTTETSPPSSAVTTTSSVTTTTAPPGASVILTRSTTEWETFAHELTRFNTIRGGSFDGETRVTTTFDTWVLENEFLRVTLLPEYGGRILSMVYKPTGHEQLYQNPLGVPYQIDTNIFFFNWLMVYGGIFPTFPEPEHGKTWFLPWDFEVVEQSADSITVSMSFTDSEDYPFVPRQYDGDATGLEVTFLITLEGGRAALDTSVIIENPSGETVEFEYWTNATFAPGSDPADPRTTAGAEIIAPVVDLLQIPSFWTGIAAVEEEFGLIDVYEFDRLRRFENWADRGIAYAFPHMRDANFWGVINHDNGEGIFRIADNDVTPGLKLWTWGFPQTADIDQANEVREDRPYIELWAGLTREFFQSTEIDAGASIRIDETYATTVGLSDVTHANENFLVHLRIDEPRTAVAEIFGLTPSSTVTARWAVDGAAISEVPLALDPLGTTISLAIPDDVTSDSIDLVLLDTDGLILLEASAGPTD